jgi:8-oxo-dGTP pyrophosphatase MutT (NUDIX family)
MATSTEFSAGGVVVRGEECVVIVPVKRAADGSKVVGLPKGHPEEGESPSDAALREVREEAGVETRLVEKLGEAKYFYMRKGKRVSKVVAFFLLDYVSGDPADHDHEIERAWWMPLADAARELTYRGEREMVALAKVHPACRS